MALSETTLRRLKSISPRLKEYDKNPKTIPSQDREDIALMMAAIFHDFREFAELGMHYLGFGISPMQLDIAHYMQHGGRKSMVQSQRGEAKSTLAALFAVWTVLQNQTARVLIISGGEKQASDVAILVVRILQNWYMLCYLRADSSRGDRTSTMNYDVHIDLKPVDKSASISCAGISANLPGKRADLLIPDDIESSANAQTQVMRNDLMIRSKEFAAICTHGKTLYLGTPQSKDSIYKSLKERGFDIRIWPGRFPNKEELLRYSPGTLAPFITERIEEDPTVQSGGGIDGSRGLPTDPVLFNEDALLEKELDYGDEGFSLQYMLDTALADEARTRIKLSDIMIGDFGSDRVPEVLMYSAEPRHLFKESTPPLAGMFMYNIASTSNEYVPYAHKVMCVDPAGAGGDEVAYCAGGVSNGYIHILALGGLRGGMTKENITHIIDRCIDVGVKLIQVEANMGHGTVSMLIRGVLAEKGLHIGVEDVYAKGQKERRIIDTISPVTRRHRLCVHKSAIEEDWVTCQKHPREKQTVMSGLYQIANITYDRNSLEKDDRADAIQQVVMELSKSLAVDSSKLEDKRKQLELQKWLENPMGYDHAEWVNNNPNKKTKVGLRGYYV